MKRIAVIMAGGYGIRLWPRSKEDSPKQFLHFSGEGSLIQNTIRRLIPFFSSEDIYVVANVSLKHLIEEQLKELPKENFIYEPVGRNTAPCIALTAAILEKKYPKDTIILAFPADHIIDNIREFHNSLDVACNLAYEKEGIVTIGIQPDRPETGYGYIQIDEHQDGIEGFYDYGVRNTCTFAEKPDRETAMRFLQSGDFLWNSGIFVCRADVFKSNLRLYAKDIYELFESLKQHIGQDTYEQELDKIYKQVVSLSIDYALLENADNVYVVKADFKWSDIGTWDEYYRISRKDARNNVIEGDVIAVNVNNCLISAHNKMISIVGISGLVVIDSEDSIFICRNGETESVKEIIDYLRRKNINTFL